MTGNGAIPSLRCVAAKGPLSTLPRHSGRPTRRAALGPSRDVAPLAAKGDLPDPHVADSASARRVRRRLRRAPASRATSRACLADLGRLPRLALLVLGSWRLSLFSQPSSADQVQLIRWHLGHDTLAPAEGVVEAHPGCAAPARDDVTRVSDERTPQGSAPGRRARTAEPPPRPAGPVAPGSS
jgi:hypothetical protein